MKTVKTAALILALIFCLSFSAALAAQQTHTLELTFEDVRAHIDRSLDSYVFFHSDTGIRIDADRVVASPGNMFVLYTRYAKKDCRVDFTAPDGMRIRSIIFGGSKDTLPNVNTGSVTQIANMKLQWDAQTPAGEKTVSFKGGAGSYSGFTNLMDGSNIQFILVKDVPATGDDADIALLIGLLVLAAAGMIVCNRRSMSYNA